MKQLKAIPKLTPACLAIFKKFIAIGYAEGFFF